MANLTHFNSLNDLLSTDTLELILISIESIVSSYFWLQLVLNHTDQLIISQRIFSSFHIETYNIIDSEGFSLIDLGSKIL